MRSLGGVEILSVTKLTTLLQPVIEDLGYEFVGLEYSTNPKNPAVVLYIDSEKGIAVEDCENVSREVAALLDVEDPIPGNYVLEVSSPGLDRPLFSVAHFDQFIGSIARVTMFAPVDGRRKFKGRILGTEDQLIALEQDGTEVKLEFGNVAKARLVPDYGKVFAEHDSQSKKD